MGKKAATAVVVVVVESLAHQNRSSNAVAEVDNRKKNHNEVEVDGESEVRCLKMEVEWYADQRRMMGREMERV